MNKAEYAAPVPDIEREVDEIIKRGPFEGPAAGHPGRAYEESKRRKAGMTTEECIKSLRVLLECVDDKLQGERDKMTKLVNLKPSSFEFVLLETIERLERHGHWIECDYKRLEHGEIETEPNAGLCCSVCRMGFQKRKMTYRQYCAACGARMDGEEEQ